MLYNSMVSLGLNFLLARSAARNLNCSPYNSNSMVGTVSNPICPVCFAFSVTFFLLRVGLMSYSGIRKVKIEFCFGITGPKHSQLHSSEPKETRNSRFISFFLVMTRKAFSVSRITIPVTPTKQGFRLCFTNAFRQDRLVSD
jgi:hypothetical protein